MEEQYDTDFIVHDCGGDICPAFITLLYILIQFGFYYQPVSCFHGLQPWQFGSVMQSSSVTSASIGSEVVIMALKKGLLSIVVEVTPGGATASAEGTLCTSSLVASYWTCTRTMRRDHHCRSS
ncbi:hypothetical protein FNV43_RR10818 [Rhamnella rubrinervis]|uniref:Uncharacterized protein n=1 Tax=Rhamnella rubrinervis TaxID=2594499 RepID=A0A8K0MH61_9ROSA|nr:hypothetical protein FNV43_RR10818 [Rhamnella rubrinervis]